MKITTRLTLAVCTGMLIMVMIGFSGLLALNHAGQRFQFFVDNTLPSLTVLMAAKDATANVRVAAWKHIASPDPVKKAEYETQIQQQLDNINRQLAAYEQLLSDERDRALLRADKEAFAAYQHEVVEIIHASAAANSEAAVAAGDKGKGGQLIAVLSQHLAYNNQLAARLDQENRGASTQARWLIGGGVAVAMLLAAVGALLLCRSIRKGLDALQQAMAGISSELDFTRRAPVLQLDEIGQTAVAFNHLLARLQTSLRHLQQGIQEVAASSQALLGASGQVAASSGNQSMSAAQMAAAIEQMTVNIRQVAMRADEAQQLAQHGAGQASGGRQEIGRVVDDIQAIAATVGEAAQDITLLETRSKDIASVVSVIRDVADQTNLLALNAAIEAARAGESGRGFAVVADEVRKLAERTAASTQEISGIIAAIQQVSGSVVSRMQRTVEQVNLGQEGGLSAQQSIEALSAGVGQSAALVADISAAIREQGMATDSMAQQVEVVAQDAEENSCAASQAAGLAARLGEIAGTMQREVSAYRV